MLSYAFGLFSARAARLSMRQTSSICIEVGMQNSALAMVISLSFLENSRMAIPPMVYSIMMFGVGWILVALFHRLNSKEVLDPKVLS
jgi:BASS family bile acid:Na+ symporter